MSFRSIPPLGDEVIDRLFSALVVRYGSAFTDRWRDLDLTVVKGDWARELAGFAHNLGAIKYALEHLPEKPPTVMEFRKVCNAAPSGSDALQIRDDANLRGPTAEELARIRAIIAQLRGHR